MIDSFIAYFEPSVGNIYCVIAVTVFTVLASISDLQSLKIPNKLNFIFFLLRGAVFFVYPLTADHLIGAALGFLLICIPAMIILLPMGGDAKFAAVLGLWIGYGGMIVSMAIGVVTFIAAAFIKKMGRKDKMALGPYISVGAWMLIAAYYLCVIIR